MVHSLLPVAIQDKSGQFSQEVAFPLSFQTRDAQEKTSEGLFKDKDLMPIMAILRTIADETVIKAAEIVCF